MINMKTNASMRRPKIFSLMLLSILILSSFTAVFSVVLASELVEDSWNTKTSMSQARYGLGVVAVDGKIYAISGQTDEQVIVGTNERYDPNKDTWVTLESMPTARSYFGIVAYEDKIYCISGNGSTEVYDVATDSWSTKTSLPVSGSQRSPVQAHVMDDKIFVIAARLLYMYDPVTDSWSQKASLPKTVASDPYVYSAAVDNQIIVITSDEGPEVLIYDQNTDVWSKGKTTGHHGFAIAVAVATSGRFAPQKIYVLSSGPSIYFMPTGDVGVYDPLNGAWEQVKDPTPRARFGVAVLDDVLYVIGGIAFLETEDQRVALAVNEQYIPIGYDPRGYSTLPTATVPVVSESPVSSDSSEAKLSRTFLTEPVIAIIIIATSIVIATPLVLYAKRKKQ